MKKTIRTLLREALSDHEIDMMLKSIQPDCDCCKYFDMEGLDRFGGMEHPIYHIIEKGKLFELEYLSPKQYIYKIANGFGVSYEDALGGAYDEDKAKKYAEAMNKGDKFPVGYYTEDDADQEGRHRAMAAMMLGCKVIPVVKIIEVSDNYANRFVKNHMDMSYEELDEMFKEKGYHGISGLDWRTFKNYINNRL